LAQQKISAFFDAGIRHFVDLTRKGELSPYDDVVKEEAGKRGVEAAYDRLSIRDADVPTPRFMKQILDILDSNLAASVPTYVHCWGGIGRTGTVVGCFLVRQGLTGDEALELLDQLWQTVPKHHRIPRSPETDEQCEYVRMWKEPGA
jgi:predicted protein tyrosine phosphatase